jgi:septation ring formation regulator EzrA
MEFSKIKHALNNLDDLQAAHMASFETELMPDIEKQMTERKQGFAELQNAINTVDLDLQTRTQLSGDPQIAEIIEHLQALMHQNKTLTERVQHHKDGLENSMRRIGKGRKVIHAYGAPVSHRNRSKVINFKN